MTPLMPSELARNSRFRVEVIWSNALTISGHESDRFDYILGVSDSLARLQYRLRDLERLVVARAIEGAK